MSGSSQLGSKSALNLSAATLLSSGVSGMRVARVNVTSAGIGACAIYDSATLAGAGATNLIAMLPSTMGLYAVDFPCFSGIVVVPSGGCVCSVSYDG